MKNAYNSERRYYMMYIKFTIACGNNSNTLSFIDNCCLKLIKCRKTLLNLIQISFLIITIFKISVCQYILVGIKLILEEVFQNEFNTLARFGAQLMTLLVYF